MAITHTVQSVVTDGGFRFVASKELTVTAAAQYQESVANSASDLAVAITIESTSLKVFALQSDQDITVKTNDSGSPQETITLKANQPVIWTEGQANVPISGDVTALYITNSSGSAANVSLLAGWDATP